MSEGKETYGVEGEPPREPSKPMADVPSPAPESRPAPAPPPPGSAAGPKGKIEAPELLSGFEEDADFDKDPEVERVVMGRPVKEPEAEKKPPVEEFVQPGIGNAKVWASVGVVLLVAAMIATGVQPAASAVQRLLRVLLILYSTLIHTGTGVVAVFVAATLLGKKLGNFELAASRMLAAVAAFSLMISLQMSLFGVPWLDRLVAPILASTAYVLLVASTFNLWKKHPLGYVVGSHFFLWLIVAIGMLLTGAIEPQPDATKAPAVKTPVVQPAPASKAATTPGG